MLDEMTHQNASKFAILYMRKHKVDMADFEAFRRVILSSINFSFLKSEFV